MKWSLRIKGIEFVSETPMEEEVLRAWIKSESWYTAKVSRKKHPGKAVILEFMEVSIPADFPEMPEEREA